MNAMGVRGQRKGGEDNSKSGSRKLRKVKNTKGGWEE